MAIFERDRWDRLQPLLDRALDLSAEHRASWLDSLRSTAPDVADELQSLLAEEESADGRGFLTDPLQEIDARRGKHRSVPRSVTPRPIPLDPRL